METRLPEDTGQDFNGENAPKELVFDDSNPTNDAQSSQNEVDALDPSTSNTASTPYKPVMPIKRDPANDTLCSDKYSKEEQDDGMIQFPDQFPKVDQAEPTEPVKRDGKLFLNQNWTPVFNTTLFCILLHVTAGQFLPKGMPRHDSIFLPQKLPSTVNALFCGTLAIKALYIDKVWKTSESIATGWSPLVDKIFAFNMGYDLYDTLLMTLSREHPSVWIHHLLSLLGLTYTRAIRRLAFYPMMFMVSELTVVITNIFWIAQRYFPPITPVREHMHMAILRARVVSFLLFRFPNAVLALLYPMYLFKSHRALWTRMREKDIPSLGWALNVFNVSTFAGLNVWWTFLVIRAIKKPTTVIHHI
jgi:hypothetical protein